VDPELPGASAAEERALGRVLALSDGVFAIAMTLLVVSLAVPDTVADDDVGSALRDELPSVAAYALSFAVIALFWLAHHRLFLAIRRLDDQLVLGNLLLLGLVALIPFPTAVLGEHGSSAAATATYAGAMALAALASSAQWWHVRRAGLAPHLSPGDLDHNFWRGATFIGVFALSIPLAFVSVAAAQLSWILVGVFRAALARRYGRVHLGGTRQPRSDRR
jgi:uncharacterized membrane protein